MRFLLAQFAIGSAAGLVFTAVLLGADTGGLGSLIVEEQAPAVPLVLLVANIAALFGIGAAVSGVSTGQHPS